MKKLMYIFTLITLTVILASCGKKQEKLVVGLMPDIDSIPLIVAKQKGYLPDNVELQMFKSAVDRDSALYSNSLDGAVSDVLAVGLARNSEFPVYITSKTHGTYGIIASEGSGIKTVADLQGKTIGLSLNTIIEYVVDSILEQENVDVDSVEKTVIPKIPTRLELLSGNKIDSIAVPEPFVFSAEQAGGTKLKTSTDLNINPGIMLFTKDATEKKKDDIKAFYDAYNKAVDFMNSNDQADYLGAVIDELGLPESTMDLELQQYTHAELPDSENVTRAVDWLVKKDLIKSPYTYEELIFQYD